MTEQEGPEVEAGDAPTPADTEVQELQERILAAVDRLAPVLAASPLEELEVESGDLVVRLAKPRIRQARACTPPGRTSTCPTSS